MTPDWHKPVKAVLDYFKLDQVTLVGLSMGGCLVMRAAAREPRVARVIACDILTDFFDVNLRQARPLLRRFLTVLLNLHAAPVVNALVAWSARNSPVTEWGVHQGMHVTGTSSPYAFLQRIRLFQTADVSPPITQDVLLMAGSDDHSVPIEQFYRQMRLLSNARSVTARLFTRAENAQNHCQVGSYGLALRTIVDWLGCPCRSG